MCICWGGVYMGGVLGGVCVLGGCISFEGMSMPLIWCKLKACPQVARVLLVYINLLEHYARSTARKTSSKTDFQNRKFKQRPSRNLVTTHLSSLLDFLIMDSKDGECYSCMPVVEFWALHRFVCLFCLFLNTLQVGSGQGETWSGSSSLAFREGLGCCRENKLRGEPGFGPR